MAKTVLSNTEFAVGAYAVLVHMKTLNADNPDYCQAIQDVLDSASESLRTSGRLAYGQIMEGLDGFQNSAR
jgi:hypothetical protein